MCHVIAFIVLLVYPFSGLLVEVVVLPIRKKTTSTPIMHCYTLFFQQKVRLCLNFISILKQYQLWHQKKKIIKTSQNLKKSTSTPYDGYRAVTLRNNQILAIIASRLFLHLLQLIKSAFFIFRLG